VSQYSVPFLIAPFWLRLELLGPLTPLFPLCGTWSPGGALSGPPLKSMNITQSYCLRPLITDADWEAVNQVRSICMPRAQQSTEQTRAYWTLHPPTSKMEARLLDEGGSVTGYSLALECFWSPVPGQWSVECRTLPDEHSGRRARILLEDAVATAKLHGAVELTALGRTSEPATIEVIQDLGFREVMRYPESVLKIADFDPAPFLPKIQKAKDLGFELLPMSEVIDRYPDDWKRLFWQFEEVVKHDIPTPDGLVEEPFDEFLKWIENPAIWTPEGAFLALKDGEWMAISAIRKNDVNPKIGNTGLTACRREARRNGLATALKVTSLLWAKEQGMTEIVTENEENNPMFQLNLALGFRDDYFWVSFKQAETPTGA
jgi:mycothiol synthase